jgi:hypothetical protein
MSHLAIQLDIPSVVYQQKPWLSKPLVSIKPFSYPWIIMNHHESISKCFPKIFYQWFGKNLKHLVQVMLGRLDGRRPETSDAEVAAIPPRTWAPKRPKKLE